MEDLPKIVLAKAAVPILYRPFDVRWTIWDRNVAVHRRERASDEMLFKNIALSTCRQVKSGSWNHTSASALPIESTTISNRTSEIGYIFPLMINNIGGSSENFSADFRNSLDTKYSHHFIPEEIFGYIYGVLHALTYRNRYADFLRRDFPRIPFPETRAEFEAISSLGWDLVETHLLRRAPTSKLGGFEGKGDRTVEHVRWLKEDARISINATQSFAPVPEAVWNFHIGGYQVLDKYLKSRKGRVLSLDEINHIPRICDALSFTIKQMAAIDIAYRAAFPAGG